MCTSHAISNVSTSLYSSPCTGFYVLSAPSSTKFPHLGWWEVRDGTSPAEHSVLFTLRVLTSSLHYPSPAQKETSLTRARAAQICAYKQKCLGNFLAAQAFSKTTADFHQRACDLPVRGFSVALNPPSYASLISNHRVTGCSYNHHATIASVSTSCQHVSIEICSVQH